MISFTQLVPLIANEHINMKELAIAVVAIFQWSTTLYNQHIVVATDNTATLAILNNGTSSSPVAVSLLRPLSALTIHLGSSISAKHIPGHMNHIPDAISRMHNPNHLSKLGSLLHAKGCPTPQIANHMTKASLAFFLQQITPHLQPAPSTNLTKRS